MANQDDVIILRAEHVPTYRRGHAVRDEAKRFRPPRNVVTLRMQVLDPPEPINRRRD